MELNKELWHEHLSHPVTKAIKDIIAERIAESKDAIVASSDAEFDRFVKGMIWAFNEVLEIKPDLIDEKLDNEEDQNDEVQG